MGKINILGTDYEIIYKEQHEDKSLASNDGYCDTSVYKIVVDTMNSTKGDLGAKKDLDSYRKKVVRHEIIHAFLNESGLSNCSWASNEEIVDWIAIQFPKLLKVFKEVDAIA